MERKIVELLLAGKSARDVMRTLKIGDRRVKKFRALAEEYGYMGKPPLVPLPPYPEALFPDGPDGRESKGSDANTLILTRKPWIVERLEIGWHPITVYEEIGMPVSRSSFYRFLHRHGLFELADSRRTRVVPEIRHSPGEALILDWGKLRDVLDPQTGKKRTLWAFVGVLGYSRYYLDEKMIGKEVLVLASSTRVSIYHAGHLIETHDRILVNNPSQMKSTKTHHLKPWEREMENGSLYRARAQKLGPDVDRFVVARRWVA